ncbi:MAG: ribosome maturation factor RimP [Planctomycetes bacterium]|nr:ribosome maturation factor RimP [Planctomycetota bacterium]
MAPIIALVERAVEAAGFEVVQVKVDARRNVRVWVDREQGGVAVQDCTRLTRRIRDVFEEDGLDPGSFQVEVQSPGLDRLLVREKDFARFAGKQVTVRLRVKRGERRQFKGPLVGLAGGLVRVTEGQETFAFDLAREVEEVRLVPEVAFPTAAELSQRREAHAVHRPKRQKKRKRR